MEQVLSALSVRGCRAVFFLTPEQIIQKDDFVRQLLGSGHLVGARLTSGNVSGALEELERAGEAGWRRDRGAGAGGLCLLADDR